jgi:uncharacterized protein (DUF952 family)
VPKPSSFILHLAGDTAWAAAARAGVYAADSLTTEGFIHCSTPQQVIPVANRLFRNRHDLVLLQIDTARVDAAIRYENLEGGTELYPHIYGPLPVSAVVRATPFPPDADGAFTDQQLLQEMAHTIAAAIGRRDVLVLADLLAPGFTYRSDAGQTALDANAFLEGIRSIPGEIAFVRLERVAVDLAGDAAMLTGVQHAQVIVDGQTIDDRRAFVDFFVKIDGAWKLRAGADFQLPGAA